MSASMLAPAEARTIPVSASRWKSRTLVVSTTTDGSTWTQVGTVTAGASAVVYQTALTNTANLVGIRFDFTNPAGFAQSATLPANVSFVARSTLRDTGLPPQSWDERMKAGQTAAKIVETTF